MTGASSRAVSMGSGPALDAYGKDPWRRSWRRQPLVVFRRAGWNPNVELRQTTAVTTESGFSENCHDRRAGSGTKITIRQCVGSTST